MSPNTVRRAVSATTLLLALWSCAPAQPRPAGSTPPAPSPEAGASLPVEANLLPSSFAGEWLVVGAASTDAGSLRGPRLSIVLHDAAGATVDRRTIDLPVDTLPSGTTWPFREAFRPPTTPASAEVVLTGLTDSPSPSGPVQAEVLRTFLDEKGTTVALGRLSYRGSTGRAEVEAVRLLGRDATGAPRDVVEGMAGASALGPDDKVPFLAAIPPGGESLHWEAHALAQPSQADAPPLDVEEIRSHEDGQGNPFVTAILRSRARDPQRVRVTAVTSSGETWLAAAAADLPILLEPGQSVPIALRLPRTSVDPAGASELQWRFFVRSSSAAGASVPLPVEVVDYLPLGSTLVLHVRLTGADSGFIRSSAAWATLSAENGTLLGAGWTGDGGALSPGATVVMTLAIPVPLGVDPAGGELDVHGSGLRP